MKLKKILIISFIALVLLAAALIIVFEGNNNMSPEKALNDFSKLVENGKTGDLSLTIYYLSPSTLTLLPVSVDMLINGYHDTKIVINGSTLKEQADLFKQLNSDALIPVKYESRIDARFYYVFKTKINRKIFDVAMWGHDYSIYVNGLEVKSNDIFYDIVMPFLSDDLAANLEVNKKDAKRIKLE